VTFDESRRPRFRKRVEPQVVADTPETLFGELPHSPRGVGALWSHQADQLRTYALTGSGKTLVGLLISDWRRTSVPTLLPKTSFAQPNSKTCVVAAGAELRLGNRQGCSVVGSGKLRSAGAWRS
jgi:hypothetical protein